MAWKILSRQKPLVILLTGLVLFVALLMITQKKKERAIPQSLVKHESQIPIGYYTNIVKETQTNENFRRVLFTGLKSQLVVMSIPPGGEIGEETHAYTEQTLFFLSGVGEAMLDEKKIPIAPGDVVVVTAGTKHNFRNTGTQTLKVYTVYAPPNHIQGRVHQTRADADADVADEAIGESKPLK